MPKGAKSLVLALALLIGRAAFAQVNNARMLSTPNAQTGTSYTFVPADTTRVVTFSNGAAVAVTLPNGATQGFGAGTMLSVLNLGAGTVTITCTSCTINGISTLVLPQAAGADIYGGVGSSAVNYVALPSPSGTNVPLLNASNTFTNANTFTQQIVSTVATGTAPLSIASTTVVPNLNAQLHNGKTAPAGNIVGDTDTQTLTGKTIDCTANTLPNNACEVYSTASASTNAAIGSTPMATAGASGNTYRFSVYVDQTVAGVGCSTNSTINVFVVFTDPHAGSAASISSSSLTISNNGAAGNPYINVFPYGVAFRSKASTTVNYGTVFSAGTCTTAPSYQVYPVLEQLQ